MVNFKSLFIREDIESPKTIVQPPISNAIFSTPISTTSSLQAMVDPKMRDALLQSLKENEQPGFDYLKFIATLAQMESVPNEQNRFMLAFTAARAVGIDKNKLVESGQYYLKLLEKSSQDFNTSLTNAQHDTVGVNESRISEIETLVISKEAQIQKLNDELMEIKKERMNLTLQTSETKTKLDIKQKNFRVTYDDLVSEISNNLQKITRYIQ